MTALQASSDRLHRLAPAGFYVALRVGFTIPKEELNRLPRPWEDFYTINGLVLQDPVMRWIYGNTGVTRWDTNDMDDPGGVRDAARRHGLMFGAVACAHQPSDHGRRSYGLFYRADRDFEEPELAALHTIIANLHVDHFDDQSLTAAEIEALKLQASGLRVKQISAIIGISDSAVKARLTNAKRKLGARTSSQAASIAAARRLI